MKDLMESFKRDADEKEKKRAKEMADLMAGFQKEGADDTDVTETDGSKQSTEDLMAMLGGNKTADVAPQASMPSRRSGTPR